MSRPKLCVHGVGLDVVNLEKAPFTHFDRVPSVQQLLQIPIDHLSRSVVLVAASVNVGGRCGPAPSHGEHTRSSIPHAPSFPARRHRPQALPCQPQLLLLLADARQLWWALQQRRCQMTRRKQRWQRCGLCGSCWPASPSSSSSGTQWWVQGMARRRGGDAGAQHVGSGAAATSRCCALRIRLAAGAAGSAATVGNSSCRKQQTHGA